MSGDLRGFLKPRLGTDAVTSTHVLLATASHVTAADRPPATGGDTQPLAGGTPKSCGRGCAGREGEGGVLVDLFLLGAMLAGDRTDVRTATG